MIKRNSREYDLAFEGGFDERAAVEAQARGYRSHVAVEFADGERYSVVFYDPVRLQQDLHEEIRAGSTCIAEPGLIVIAEVTLENMRLAVDRLVREGYFEALRPMGVPSDGAIHD
jgi:hypothetical protein